ncbi:MAG: DUF362 domain-containing protein [Sedimentisphaerales bacterium]|nr:DUF362 domain-containing protein [Sedimentisphaerales bacterium]
MCQARATVTVTQCTDYSQQKVAESLRRQFDLLGGLERFAKPGDRVLIKPNFIAPKSRRRAVQTDPAVIIELARLLKDFGAKPFVGDSPAWGNVFGCVKALHLEEPLKQLAVPVKQLNKPKYFIIGPEKTRVGISTVALDADVIINLPKFKTHQQLTATFAVKNIFGCVSGKRKAILHFTRGKSTTGFCRMLIEIYKLLKPAVTIIDAVTVMDGPGPIRGRARELGWIIGGIDPAACEVICCKLANIELQKLPMIKAAKEMGYGCTESESIETTGDKLGLKPSTDFEPARLIPLRFSLAHICKSLFKQLLLLAKDIGNK